MSNNEKYLMGKLIASMLNVFAIMILTLYGWWHQDTYGDLPKWFPFPAAILFTLTLYLTWALIRNPGTPPKDLLESRDRTKRAAKKGAKKHNASS